LNGIISAKVFEICSLYHYSRLENLENKHNHQSHQEKLLTILGIDDYFGDTFDAKDDQFD
jgi:FMN phosphatase YigB (HAD superfamily)